MSFRSIGTLAGDVLRKAELRATRQATVAMDGDEPVAQGVRPSPSPIAQAGRTASNANDVPVYIAPRTGKRVEGPSGEPPGCELNGKKAGTPVSETSRPVEGRSQQSGKPAHALDMHAYGDHMATVLRLSRCERIANPRPGAISPVAAMRSHLLSELNRHSTSTGLGEMT